jgi:hypothetical protein
MKPFPAITVKPARLNKDFFANAKAQSWWHLRKLFRNTFRAERDGLQPRRNHFDQQHDENKTAC